MQDRPRTRPEKRPADTEFAVLARETLDLLIHERGWSRQDAADQWGIPYSTLTAILLGTNAISAEVLSKVLQRERMSPVELFSHHPRCQTRNVVGDLAADDREERVLRRFLGAAQSLDRAEEVVARLERAVKLGVYDTLAQQITGVLDAAAAAAKAERNRSSRRRPRK